jgi:post-segregation antitoxin (ccd killing protein)
MIIFSKGVDNMSLKNRDRFSSTVDKELLSNLKKLSEDTRIPISKLLDEAIADLLKKHKR